MLGSQRSWELLPLHSPDLACGSGPGSTDDCLCPEVKEGGAGHGEDAALITEMSFQVEQVTQP